MGHQRAVAAAAAGGDDGHVVLHVFPKVPHDEGQRGVGGRGGTDREVGGSVHLEEEEEEVEKMLPRREAEEGHRCSPTHPESVS